MSEWLTVCGHKRGMKVVGGLTGGHHNVAGVAVDRNRSRSSGAVGCHARRKYEVQLVNDLAGRGPAVSDAPYRAVRTIGHSSRAASCQLKTNVQPQSTRQVRAAAVL